MMRVTIEGDIHQIVDVCQTLAHAQKRGQFPTPAEVEASRARRKVRRERKALRKQIEQRRAILHRAYVILLRSGNQGDLKAAFARALSGKDETTEDLLQQARQIGGTKPSVSGPTGERT